MVDEIAGFLGRITSPLSSHWERRLSGKLREQWSCSFGVAQGRTLDMNIVIVGGSHGADGTEDGTAACGSIHHTHSHSSRGLRPR
jgi:hypothetical protein